MEFERNEDKIKYLPWQDVSNGMRLDSERYLVPEKIDNLGAQTFLFCFYSFNVHISRIFMKKTRGFFYKTRIMAELIVKVMKGGFLKYIKYKKYFMQRAKIQAEKDSDQY